MLKTFLWYPKDLGRALTFYKSVFKEHMIIQEESELGEGEVFTADFSIFGQ